MFKPRIQGRTMAAAAVLATLAGTAGADGSSRLPLLPKYSQECGSCHIAFPPAMLGAASWQRLMADLSRHFGTDASLDAATTRELSVWLVAHAGNERRVGSTAPEDRITRTPDFRREHREVPAATWKLPAVKSPTNCSACHLLADRGDFDERNLRLPR